MSITFELLLLCCYFLHTNTLDCRDEENNIVDWFVTYKIPAIKQHVSKNIKDGVAYIHMTSQDQTWKLSNISINSSKSIIGNTLAKLYENESDISYILYNDEPPNGTTTETKGHTKGVIVTDNNGGFWLIHSVPRFPQIIKSYMYPKSGHNYGQTFLCISMDLENINKVGLQLQYNQPDIYDQNILTNMKSLVPDLASAANNVTIKTAPWYHITTLQSKKNDQFISFAKSQQYNKEIYVDLVAPFLKSDLKVETWLNGPGRLKSNCSQRFKVKNVQSITMMNIAKATFKSSHDHSKWAVSSEKSKKYWTCIGDINREEHQEIRGGGTVCNNNENLTSSFQNLISSMEEC